jgi:hypothetical protein
MLTERKQRMLAPSELHVCGRRFIMAKSTSSCLLAYKMDGVNVSLSYYGRTNNMKTLNMQRLIFFDNIRCHRFKILALFKIQNED